VEATPVTTWYLQMTDRAQLAPAPQPDPDLEVRQAELPAPELARALYLAVGADWYWTDRLDWDWQTWRDRLARPEVELWVGYVRGTPAGYAEIEHAGGAVELASFGLLPAYFGQGHGPRLLDAVIRRAWALGPARVWLHTCTLDGPAALLTYQRRGFTVYDERQDRAERLDERPEVWPGARRPRP
jgi:ribosomal protein S18 acetylase RimI-like enzyme